MSDSMNDSTNDSTNDFDPNDWEGFKDIHDNNDPFLMNGQDVNRMIAIVKLIMAMRPSLNEYLMDWLGYLHDIKPLIAKEKPFDSTNEKHSDDSTNEKVQSYVDELAWRLGLKLPSWSDKDE